MKNPFRRTTYLDFMAGMIVVATPPRKSKIRKQVLLIKNVHINDDTVSSVFIRPLASKIANGYLYYYPKAQITSHIIKPKEYFAGMKFKILK